MGFSDTIDTTDIPANLVLDNSATENTLQMNQCNRISILETEIKQLHKEILEIKTNNKIDNKIDNKTYNNDITLSDLLIKTFVSRIENMLKFTAQFYTNILEMAPGILIFLIIVKYILFVEC